MTSAFSWQNSISLCPVSFCTPKPYLPVTPGISCLLTFAFQSPIMKQTSFLGVSSRRSCKSSWNCSTSASSILLFDAQSWIDLDYCDIEWFALETNRDHTVIFEIASKYAFQTFDDYEGYSISSKGFLPTVIDIMVI